MKKMRKKICKKSSKTFQNAIFNKKIEKTIHI
jgi:hypothetical protein